MTSAWSQLEQMLTCAICLDKFKNPRLLPCQHSFCGDACMEGLVDYARRQIKCPECRAEHRIPYQGVASLPSNVTLIRFLELHSRITGEEPEPVPTFMEKCSVCGEKVEGVQRCWHCEKKVCPECKEAHLDLLRREISRLNNQSRRCFGKLKEFDETLVKAQDRLTTNKRAVLKEIEDSTKRLIEDLQAKQKKLCQEVESFAEQEEKLLSKLQSSCKDELQILEANLKLADEKINGDHKYPWTDRELNEMKEIYSRSMEFVRLFDPDVGDFTRKIRFCLIPEFEVMRRRICELGELKFSESANSLMASSFQYSNAVGSVALEVIQAAAQQQPANGAGGYGLSQSNSNSNLGGMSASAMLELPSMQNALMRSQSDHRLASQFQQRLKQQQQQQDASATSGAAGSASRYGARHGNTDHEMDSLRSRYAPPGRSTIGAKSDYANDLLTRDWPRPTDNDSDSLPFGSSIQFKSAFMRRKEKERSTYGQSYSGAASNVDDDEDLVSEASYGGASGRNVRFYDQQQADQRTGAGQAAPKLFDFREAERAPFSGVPRLDNTPHTLERLHQMGAKAIVDQKLEEEEGKRDKDLVESARQAMAKVSEQSKTRQASEDEIERQKRANKQLETRERTGTLTSAAPDPVVPEPAPAAQEPASAPGGSAGGATDSNSSTPNTSTPTTITGGRRGLYGAAVTEKSRRQLSSAIQDAATMVRRRSQTGVESGGSDPASPEVSRAKRTLRSGGRSASRQSSIENADGSGSSTPRMSRRARLSKMDSSQASLTEQTTSKTSFSEPKNSTAGSAHIGYSTTGDPGRRVAAADSSERPDSPTSEEQSSSRVQTRSRYEPSQASSTIVPPTSSSITDGDGEPATLVAERPDPAGECEQDPTSSDSNNRRSSDDSDADPTRDEADESGSQKYDGRRNTDNRRSREFLPTSVNKLLDRSAQIRRDSQEQRSRGDSPQRTDTGYGGARAGYSRNQRPVTSYQRQVADDEATTNSNNSIYTTASSGSRSGGGLSSQRSVSIDDQDTNSTGSGRRLSGNSSDRTLTGTGGSSSYRRNDSGESQQSSGGYQSRFLARSRTSAALSSPSTSRTSSLRDQQEASTDELGTQSSARSYLSSRDRFMQSASVLGSSSGSTPANSSSNTGGSSLYGGAGGSSRTSGGAHPAGKSEYLRNKYGSSRRNSSNSSGNSTSYLLRSRSSHTGFARSHSNENSSNNSPASDDDRDESVADNSYGIRGGSRRSSLAGIELSVAARYLSKGRMLFKLGSRGSEPGSFTWPRGVALGLGARGREIVVADSSNHRVQVFDTEGRFLNEFGSYGSDQAQFDCLAGVAINRVHRNYVISDRYNHRIQVFDLDGRFVRAFGELGRESGRFNLPWGVACDQSSGLIYVCDKENHRVQVFDIDGQHVSKFGLCGTELGQLQHPHYIAVQAGKVVVTDTNNHRVQVFDAQTGRALSSFGKEGSLDGQFKFPRGVAMDSAGCIIVGDSGNNRLQIFAPDGVFIKSIGTWGSADGEFKGIEGVAVDSSNYNIFVCDRENHRIQVF